MLKTDKILKQTITMMVLIAVWIGISISFLMMDLSAQKELNDHQGLLSSLTMQVNTYYQDILDRTQIESSLITNDSNQIERQELILKSLAVEFKVMYDSVNTLTLMDENTGDLLTQSIMRAVEAIERLSKREENQGSQFSIVYEGQTLKVLMDEISLNNQLILEEQSLRQSRIMQRIVISALSVLLIVIGTFVWLLVFRTLNPLKRINSVLSGDDGAYRRPVLKVASDDEIGELIKSYNELQGRASTVESLINKLGEKDHFEDILDFIFKSFKPFIPYNRIGIAVLSSDQTQIRALSARSDRAVKLGKNYTLNLSETSLESIIESGEPRILNDLESYYALRRHSESTGLMIDEGMCSSVTMPLIVRKECVGVVFFSSIDKYTYTQSHITFLRTIAGSLASAFDHSFLNDQLLVSTIQGFAQLVESKDSETGNHIDRMQRYSVMIAELLYMNKAYKEELTEQMIKQIRDFSPLHDIGKVAVPDNILLKPGRLTSEEFGIMKDHAVIGADILHNMNNQITGQNRDFYKTGIEIVRHHHERYDGSGYPDKLKGLEIPLSARIVALADVLDALMSKRPYKEAFSITKAKEIVADGRGSHFDPIIVDVVIEYWEKFAKQAEVFNIRDSDDTLSLIS